MSENIFSDFPEVFFIYIIPILIGSKILFYVWYKCNGNTSTVDVGYVINHWVAGTIYFIFFESYEEW